MCGAIVCPQFQRLGPSAELRHDRGDACWKPAGDSSLSGRRIMVGYINSLGNSSRTMVPLSGDEGSIRIVSFFNDFHKQKRALACPSALWSDEVMNRPNPR